MQSFGLDELFAPITKEKFLTSHWPDRPLFVPPSKKLSTIRKLPILESIETLLAARNEAVRAYLPGFNDEYQSALLDPKEALAAYRNDRTLVLDSLQMDSPELAQVLATLQSELGLPTNHGEIELTQARVIAYATPAGGHTQLHFDANANFVVQIKGSKRWGLAPNDSVKDPTDRYTAGSGEISLTLEKQCHAPLLDKLPENSPEYLLEPGAVLFVPRGYWHETSTEEDSLSLTFAFSQPTRADLFLVALRDHLHKLPEWRSLAQRNPATLESEVQRCLLTVTE